METDRSVVALRTIPEKSGVYYNVVLCTQMLYSYEIILSIYAQTDAQEFCIHVSFAYLHKVFGLLLYNEIKSSKCFGRVYVYSQHLCTVMMLTVYQLCIYTLFLCAIQASPAVSMQVSLPMRSL